jgi:hypothetical protein
MNTGKSLMDLRGELIRRLDTKRDFVTPARFLTADVKEIGEQKHIFITMDDGSQGHEFAVNPTAHKQIREWANIPAKYYDLMLSKAPDLLRDNVNYWFNNVEAKRLVRTIDGRMRAYLSNNYRIIDNYDIANTIVPILAADPSLKIVSADVTDDNLYLKAFSERLTFEPKVGDVVKMGITIRVNEVGEGAIDIAPFLFRLSCTNGATIEDLSLRKFHAGRKISDIDIIYEVLQDETKKLTDQAFLAQVGDLVRASMDEVNFDKVKTKAIDATTRRISVDLEPVLDRIVEKFDVRGTERAAVLKNLVDDGDGLTQWGLANAITKVANDNPEYVESDRLEKAGGKVMSLDDQAWATLAQR